jgi:hypothetical protein
LFQYIFGGGIIPRIYRQVMAPQLVRLVFGELDVVVFNVLSKERFVLVEAFGQHR